MRAAHNRLHVLFVVLLKISRLPTALDESVGELGPLTAPQHIDLRLIVVAVVRRGNPMLVLAALEGLNVSDSTLIAVMIREAISRAPMGE